MSLAIESTSSLDYVEDIPRRNEENHLPSLRPEENAFPLIFSLPSELLELIFIHVAQDYYESLDSCLEDETPDWINVSYVCRRWRNVALNCPTLWTYHLNLSLRWTEELLRRSGQVPLNITCIDPDHGASWWSGFLGKLQNHSERIQELRLHVSPSYLPAELFLHVSRLEALVIAANEPFSGRLMITDAGRPVLRMIGLENCSLQWNLLNLSGLEVLSLSHDSPHDPFNFVELLTAMYSMQNLTILHINNALPNIDVGSSGDYGVSHKINLPQLASLVVNAPLRMLIFFLSYVEMPLETRISLALWLEHNPPPAEDYARISAFLAQRFIDGQSSTSSLTIRSLGMYLGGCTALTFSSLEYDCRSRSPYQYDGFDSTILLEIAFRDGIEVSGPDGGAALLHPIVADMCCSLPLSHVQTLCVRGNGYPCKFNFWREVLGCLDGLRYLRMEESYMPDLSMLSLAALKPENSDGEPTDSAQDPSLGRILVPALEKVVLDRVYFLPDHITEHDSGMSKKAFMDILFARNMHQDKVVLERCRVPEEFGV